MRKTALLGLISVMALICLGSCGALGAIFDLPNSERPHTEHTYEYVGNPYTHQKVFTCGCPTPDIAEEHSDADADGKCDLCGYATVPDHTEHTGVMRHGTEAHWFEYTCGCPSLEVGELHYDHDGNLICDACGYAMPGHEHTVIAHGGATTHWFEYACGCPSPNLAELHSDSDGNLICDVCGYAMPGHEHTL
jgi:hypothetical protein